MSGFITIKYKLSTKPSLFFFDAKKESKKLFFWGGGRIPTNALRLFLFILLLPLHLNALYLYTSYN